MPALTLCGSVFAGTIKITILKNRLTEDSMKKQEPIIELDLYLIRHGESRGNAGCSGDNPDIKEANDPVLTEKGLSQAEKAGAYLKSVDFDAVYSSALRRAVGTAAEILKCQPGEKALNILPLLTEVGVSAEYNGASMEEIKDICPCARLANGVDPSSSLVCHSVRDEEEETFSRAAKALRYLRERYSGGEKVAVVSHAAFMTYFVLLIMGFRKTPPFDFEFYNTGITRIVFYKQGTNPFGDIVFEYMNETAHLKSK